MKLWTNHKKKLLTGLSTILLCLLAGLAWGVYFVTSQDFQVLAANNVVRLIRDRTGMETTLESFQIDFGTKGFALIGLVMRGNEDVADPPLLSIDRVDVELRWRALLSRRVDLTSLKVHRPHFRLEIGDNGATNMTTLSFSPEGEPRGFELFISNLVVSDGTLSFDEERVNIDFQLADFGGSFDYTDEVLSGHIEYEGVIASLISAEIPYFVEADFDYTQGTALVEAMSFRSGNTSLQVQGRIDDFLSRRLGVLEYTGSVDLPFLNYFFPEEEFDGQFEVAGELELSTVHLSTTGVMDSRSLRFREWIATDISSDYSYDFPARVLTAESFDAELFDGRVSGNVAVLPVPGEALIELDIIYQDIDVAELRDLYPWNSRFLIRSDATGEISGWFRGAFEDFDLSGDVILQPYPVAATETNNSAIDLPIMGMSAYRGTPEQIEVEGLVGRLGSTSVEANGVIRADNLELGVKLQSGDLTDLSFVHSGMNGSGEFEGLLKGRLARPDAVGQILLQNFNYEPWTIDRISGQAWIENDVISLDRVRVNEGVSVLVVDGTYNLQTRRPDLDVEISQLDPVDISHWVPYPINGIVFGDAHIDSFVPISANGNLRGVGINFDQQELGNIEANVMVRENDDIQFRNAQIRRDGAILSGSFDLNRQSGDLKGELEAAGQQLADYQWLGVPKAIKGHVGAAAFVVAGTYTSPLITGQATIDNLQFREQVFDRAVVNVDHDGSVVFADIAAGDQLTLELELYTSEMGVPFQGLAGFNNYDAARMTGMAPGTVTATGTAEFSAELSDFRTLEGTGEVMELSVHLDEDDLIVAPPFPFEFNDEEVVLSNVELSDETTLITVDGEVLMTSEAPIELDIVGELDLSLLYPRYVNFVTSGTLSFEGEVRGTLANPQLDDGRATLNNASVDHTSLLLGLSELNGELAFDGERVTLIDIEGTAGTGAATVGGTIGIEGFRPNDLDLRVDATNVRLRTPEGFRTIFNAALSFDGTVEAPSLTGNVDVVSLSFDESFEELVAMFGEPVVSGLAPDEGPLDGLTLAVHVEGDQGIRIENELVRVDARLDLNIGGTFGEPSIVGHVESLDGVLDLQGNRYLITRGNVDFVDPIGIEPLIDMQAETELRDYRVILMLNGLTNNVQVDMASDPPLPQLEIISLMAGGRTREELADDNGLGALPTSEELFQGAAAATFMNDLLAERVGSRFGLGSLVRIDPFLVGAENDPVARVTISEEITRDLIITYSQDLSSNRQEIILIEYFLDNNTSFIASRDETGAMGLDIRLRKRFR